MRCSGCSPKQCNLLILDMVPTKQCPNSPHNSPKRGKTGGSRPTTPVLTHRLAAGVEFDAQIQELTRPPQGKHKPGAWGENQGQSWSRCQKGVCDVLLACYCLLTIWGEGCHNKKRSPHPCQHTPTLFYSLCEVLFALSPLQSCSVLHLSLHVHVTPHLPTNITLFHSLS